MTPADRLEELEILMPGTPSRVLRFLAADNALSPWETTFEERNLYSEPVRDFFAKFRIDKPKLQRLLNCCGDVGARWLSNRHYYWWREFVQAEAEDYGVAAEAARALSPDHKGEDFADAVNETVAKHRDGEPVVMFDAYRAALVLKCDDALKRSGKYVNLPSKAAHKLLRSLVRKAEIDPRKRSPEELLGLTPSRSSMPHVVFADKRFGDGRRFIQELDADGNVTRQYKESTFTPIIPAFEGKSRQEQEQMIRDQIQRHLERKAAKK